MNDCGHVFVGAPTGPKGIDSKPLQTEGQDVYKFDFLVDDNLRAQWYVYEPGRFSPIAACVHKRYAKLIADTLNGNNSAPAWIEEPEEYSREIDHE